MPTSFSPPLLHAQNTTNSIELSIVSPVYGCEGCLEALCERIFAALEPLKLRLEIVLVCDASPDQSWLRMMQLAQRDSRIVCLRLTRNFGQHAAISAGLHCASGAWVAVMDCDLQDQPEEIPALYQRALQGVDAAIAARTTRQDGWIKRRLSAAFYRLLGYLTGEKQDPSAANFGVYSRRLVDTINAMPESGRFFPLMVRWTGFPRVLLPVQHAQRASGRSGYSFLAQLRLALNVITSHSDRPLRLVAKTGLIFASISFGFVLLSVYRYWAGDIAVAGFTSVIASIWLVGGVMISCLGVVGLYVGKIFTESKRRPHFLVAESINTDVPTATLSEPGKP